MRLSPRGVFVVLMATAPCLKSTLLRAAAEMPFHNYELDVAHSKVGFEVSHLVIATVDGQFNKFSGVFEYDPKTSEVKNANITIDAASINTNEDKRDEHLRSPDFFDVKKFPNIQFKNAKIELAAGKPSKLHGTLVMHGVEKPVMLNVDYKGAVTDPWGNQKIVFNLKGTVNRKDFGLNWNKKLDAGGLMIGDEVVMVIKVEANRKDKPGTTN